MSEAPEAEHYGLIAADIAWAMSDGTPAERTRQAIRAYLWATTDPLPSVSVNDVMEALS